MTTTTFTTDVAVVDPQFSDAEPYALAAFLAGYRGLTREAYALDLRQFIAWWDQHHLRMFDERRAEIECFARDLEERGRARATVARRFCTAAGFSRYAEQEGLLERSPAAHVRRPRLDYESRTALDRNEIGSKVRALLMTRAASSGGSSASLGCATLALLRTGLSGSRIVPQALRSRSISPGRGPRSRSRGWSRRSAFSRAAIEFHLDMMRQRGDGIPPPTTVVTT